MPITPIGPLLQPEPPQPGGLGERIINGLLYWAGRLVDVTLKPISEGLDNLLRNLFGLGDLEAEEKLVQSLESLEQQVKEAGLAISLGGLIGPWFRGLPVIAKLFAHGAVVSSFVGFVIGTFQKRFFATLGFQIARAFPVFRISAEDGVLAERRGALASTLLISDLLDLGVSEDRINALIARSYRWVTSGNIEEMFYRGIIDQGRAATLLKGIGLPDDQVAEYIQTFTRLPAPSDLTRFAIREVFTPQLQEALRVPSPGEDYYTWAAKVGYSREVADFYWMAHWRLIGEARASDIARRVGRGGTVEGQDTQEWYFELLRRDDVLSKYWKPLWDTHYRAVSRIDVWRLAQAGKIDRDQAYEWYQDYGYSPEIAALMADAGAKSSTLTNRELTRADIVAAYQRGLLVRDEAVAALMDQGFEEDEISLVLARADYDTAQKTASRRASTVRTRYLGNIIDSGAAQVQLAEAGLTPTEIEENLRLWTEEREARVERPTVSQLIGFYKQRLISGPDLEAEIRAHGYQDRYVQLYIADAEADLALAAARQSRAEKGAAARRIKLPTKADLLDWFEAGIITLDDFRESMAGQGYSPESIDHYLKEAGIVVVTPAYKTEVGKVQLTTLKLLFRGGQLPEADFRAGLLALDMAPALVDAILEYELVKATPPAP